MMGHALIKIKKNQLHQGIMPKNAVFKVIKRTNEDLTIRVPYQSLADIQMNYELLAYTGLIGYLLYLKSNKAIFFGILIFVGFLYIHSISIKRIEFNAYTKDNERIEAIIQDNITTKMGFEFLDADLNELNFELRKDFSHFEWIDVRKVGTVLKVTVLEPSIINKKTEKQIGAGDLVASETGFITSYQVQNGIIMVTRKQYVEKGQLLVSGNLRVLREGQEPFYIQASGQVHANVQYVKTVEVLKKQVNHEYTGKIITNKKISIFGLDIKYTNRTVNFSDYDRHTTEKQLKIFGFELPFGLKKTHYYEKNDIIKLYDDKTAYDYALSSAVYQITSHFEEDDVIVEQILLSQNESDDRYVYQFLIIANENIAEFKRSNVDE